MSTNSAERRASPREQLDCPVRLKAGEEAQSGRLTSLSRMGALAVVDRPLAVGTPLTLEVDLPHGQGVMTLRGQIVRAEPSGNSHALGVLFAPLAPATLALIDSLMSS